MIFQACLLIFHAEGDTEQLVSIANVFVLLEYIPDMCHLVGRIYCICQYHAISLQPGLPKDCIR